MKKQAVYPKRKYEVSPVMKQAMLPIVYVTHNSSSLICDSIKSFIEHADNINFFYIVIDSCSDNQKYDEMLVLLNDNFMCDCINNFAFLDNPIRNKVYYHRFEQNIGYSQANNYATKALVNQDYAYAILANPDIELIDNVSIKVLQKDVEDNDRVLAVFPQIIDTNNCVEGNNQGPYNRVTFKTIILKEIPLLRKINRKLCSCFKKNRIENPREIYTSLGCFIFINLPNFHKVDYFDEDFFLYKEERVLGEKAIALGLVMLLDTDAKILHKHDYSSTPVFNTFMHTSEVLFYKKYLHLKGIKRIIIKILFAIKHKKSVYIE